MTASIVHKLMVIRGMNLCHLKTVDPTHRPRVYLVCFINFILYKIMHILSLISGRPNGQLN
jgi:hypothetical protein